MRTELTLYPMTDTGQSDKLSKTIFSALIGLLLTASACGQLPGSSGFRELRSLSNTAERTSRFSRFSVDEQIDILLFSQQYAQDTVGILELIAEDGTYKIPKILKRLDSLDSSDPRPRVALIRALDLIDTRCKCLRSVDGALETLARKELEIEESDIEGIKEFKALYRKIRVDIGVRAAERRGN